MPLVGHCHNPSPQSGPPLYWEWDHFSYIEIIEGGVLHIVTNLWLPCWSVFCNISTGHSPYHTRQMPLPAIHCSPSCTAIAIHPSQPIVHRHCQPAITAHHMHCRYCQPWCIHHRSCPSCSAIASHHQRLQRDSWYACWFLLSFPLTRMWSALVTMHMQGSGCKPSQHDQSTILMMIM